MDYCILENSILFIKTVQITKEIETSNGKIVFENCRVYSGTRILFDHSVRVVNCIIKGDCFIDSDINNCKWNGSTLTIKTDQQSPFKFNNINITGQIKAIRTKGEIKISTSDYFFEISGSNYGILNLGKIHFDNYSSLKIRSLGSVGILNNKNSFLKITSFNGCLFNLSKGIENTGKGKIKSGFRGIMMRSDSRQLTVPFSETPSRISGKIIKNTESVRRFDLINIQNLSEESKLQNVIKIKIKDFKFIPILINSYRITNQTNSIQTFGYISERYFKIDGKVILKPHSSVEFDIFTDISMDSDLTVNGNVLITNSVIKKSSINLSGNLSNSILLNTVLSLDENVDGLIMNGEKVYAEI